MYFYTHKINKNENKQNILLEMPGSACICYGNGTSVYGIGTFSFLKKSCGAVCYRNFFILTTPVTTI